MDFDTPPSIQLIALLGAEQQCGPVRAAGRVAPVPVNGDRIGGQTIFGRSTLACEVRRAAVVLFASCGIVGSAPRPALRDSDPARHGLN